MSKFISSLNVQEHSFWLQGPTMVTSWWKTFLLMETESELALHYASSQFVTPGYSLNFISFSSKTMDWEVVIRNRKYEEGFHHFCETAFYLWCLKEMFKFGRQAYITCFHALFYQLKKRKRKNI